MSITIQPGETDAGKRAVEFILIGLDLAPLPTNKTGEQPELQVDGGAWTPIGIGTLALQVGSVNHYLAELSQGQCVEGRTIRTRYVAADVADGLGETVEIEFAPTAALAAVGLDKAVQIGAVGATGIGPEAFPTNLTIADLDNNVGDMLLGCKCQFTSGPNRGQWRFVEKTQTAGGVVALDFNDHPWNVIPEPGDTFVLVPGGADATHTPGLPNKVGVVSVGSERTEFRPDIAPTTADQWLGMGLNFITGANKGATRRIMATTYHDAGGVGYWTITTRAFPADIVQGDRFTIGGYLAGDPLLNAVPGGYEAGTAGYALGNPPAPGVQIISGNVNPLGSKFSLGIVRGDDNPFTWQLKSAAGTIISLAGATVALIAKATDEEDSEKLWTWEGVVVGDGSTGAVTFSPDAADTAAAGIEELRQYPAYVNIVKGGKTQTILGTATVGGRYVDVTAGP